MDVGGHAGQMTKLFASLAPKGKIYTFEPGTYAYSILNFIHKMKNLKNVRIFKMGVSSHAGILTLSIPIKKSGSIGYGISHISSHGASDSSPLLQEKIPVITLDEFREHHQIKHISFIKIDVEGHEFEVLKGATKIIQDCKPAFMIEINSGFLKRSGSSAAEIFSFFQERGYRHLKIDEKLGQFISSPQQEDTDYLFYI